MPDDRTCTLCGSTDNRVLRFLGDDGRACTDCADALDAWADAIDAETTRTHGGPVAQRCPRRNELSQQGGDPDEFPDVWRYRDGRFSCSYCGSLHPDVFIERIKSGDAVIPTDKTYKAYLRPDHAKFYFQHLDEVHRAAFVAMLNVRNGHTELALPGTPAMNIDYPGRFSTEPFFLVRTLPTA